MSHKISCYFSSLIVGTGLAAMLPVSALAASFPTLTPPPSGPVAAPTSDVRVLLAAKPPSLYRTFSYNGYSFEIPRTWKAEKTAADFSGGNKVNAEVVFKNADGTQAARLICPPMPLGLEGMDTQGWSRKVVKNNFLYEFNLVLGKPEGQKAATFAFVSMTHVGYGSNEWYTDPGYGCELTLDAVPNLDATAKRIYRSAKIEDWKTYAGASLTFKYPKAWTAIELRKTNQVEFKDVNGNRVALLDRQIIETGYEGNEFTKYGRSLVRTDKKTGNPVRYDAKLWLGEPIEDVSDSQVALILWDRRQAQANLPPSASSGQLFTHRDGQFGIFREIYKSLK